MNRPFDPPIPAFGLTHSYAERLPHFALDVAPEPAPAPRLIRFNRALAADLGLDPDAVEPVAHLVFSGTRLPPDARPVAQAYAGHQFGGFSPQLGDGRAHLLGEVIDTSGQRRDIALKGSGQTPFSRRGDGKAALGPVLREYLMGEAMAALGVPTTRVLAAVTTGAPVFREQELPGAVLARVASSHIRVGTFQFFAARGEWDRVALLLDYTIARHFPDLADADNRALAFLQAVADRQARLIAQWMGLGFIHGVMNTDNMALSGETIDYGPCAWMEGYAPGTVFSSIDQTGRYAYANQPLILGWNLARLAETLLPLIDADEDRTVDAAMAVLTGVKDRYEAEWTAVMRRKLGLEGQDAGDRDLALGLLAAMEGQGADWTLTFRRLADAAEGDTGMLRPLFADARALDAWLPRWQARAGEGAAPRLRAANPLHVPRNHLVEAALAAAHQGDLGPFDRLLAALSHPFEARAGLEDLALPAPEGFLRGYRTYCGT